MFYFLIHDNCSTLHIKGFVYVKFCYIITTWTGFYLSSDSIREKMKKNYLSNPSYNYDQVNRASLACGPMVKWAIAQVRKHKRYED